MTATKTTAEKLDFKKILPVLVIILVTCSGCRSSSAHAALRRRFGANAFVIGLLGATYPAMQFIGAPIWAVFQIALAAARSCSSARLGLFLDSSCLDLPMRSRCCFFAHHRRPFRREHFHRAAVVTDVTTDQTRTQVWPDWAAFGMGFILGRSSPSQS